LKSRPVLAATAAATALALCTYSATASAAGSTAARPAAGSASSLLSLLQVTAAGHTVSVGDVLLSSDTLTGAPLSRIDLTPLVADGTPYGRQSVTPASPPATVPSQSSPGALAGIVSLASPVFSAAATAAPAATAGASSLGALTVLGLPVALDGSLSLGSAVSSTTGALASKTLVVKDLALPSVADLLAALGLDLTKLPVATLEALVQQLDLVTGAISTAEAAATSALGQIATATTAVTTATTGLTQATQGLAAPTAALQALLDQLPAASLLGLPAGSDTVAGFQALSPLQQSVLAALVPGIDAALTSLTDAQALVTTATAAVAAAEAALSSLTAQLQALLAPLVSLLTGALDSTPLLSIDSLALTSKAAASSDQPGGQQAEVLGGTLTGLHVLGQDVLDTALGTSSLNLADLVGGTATQVTGAINGLTGTLSSVLSTVPGLPALKVPAPQISLLTKSSSTSVSGGFGRAVTNVTGLKIALPSISLPAAVALPGASALPGLSLVNGLLTSAPLSLSLGTLSDQAAFRPAVIASAPTTPVVQVPTTPTTPVTTPTSPELPHTGLPAGLAGLALLSLVGALALRRRSQV
jgi:hypothetical protein